MKETRAPSAPPALATQPAASRRVALALAAAAGLHLASFPGHFRAGAVVATFFLLAAGVQLKAAASVQRGIRAKTAIAVAVANAGLVALWAVSRTVGVPGVHGGSPEPIGLLDTLAVAAEVVAVVGLFRLVTGAAVVVGSRQRRQRAVVLTASLFGAAGLVVAPTGHGHHEHRLGPTPAVAAEDLPGSAPYGPGPYSEPSDDRTAVDAARRDAGCADHPGCDHAHRHGHHPH